MGSRLIKGYKYNTQIEVINAINQCNEYYGITNNPNNITKTWTEFSYDSNFGFYFIIHDESLSIVLGSPIEFEIHIPSISLND